MGNKYEEMEYLIEKLKEKKEEKLNELNKKWEEKYSKKKTVEYDKYVPKEDCVIKKFYIGRNLKNTEVGRTLYNDIENYENSFKHIIEVKLTFKKSYWGFVYKADTFNKLIKHIGNKNMNIGNKNIKEKIKEKEIFIYELEIENYQLEDLEEVKILSHYKSPKYPKPKIQYVYIDNNKMKLLDKKKEKIIKKYKKKIKEVKINYYPKYLHSILIEQEDRGIKDIVNEVFSEIKIK